MKSCIFELPIWYAVQLAMTSNGTGQLARPLSAAFYDRSAFSERRSYQSCFDHGCFDQCDYDQSQYQ